MTIAKLPVDIFVQIGFLVLVGMACKNAILIVEFAQEQWQQGQELHDAALGGARVRFRPIVMTSLAFIGGVFPLVIATGAGAEMRQSLGTAVFAGMIGVGLFGVLLTPVFFYVLMWFRSDRRTGAAPLTPAGASGVDARATPSGAAEAGPPRTLRTPDTDSSSSKRVPTGPDGRDEAK
jgi:multidrug efflux pump